MDKKDEVAFVAKKQDKHFKMDKQTKRMMALSSFPVAPKLNPQEVAALKQDKGIVLETLTRNDFKDLFIKGQLSQVDARASGLRDPLWKPKKVKDEAVEEGDGAGTATPGSKARKGKNKPKMRAAKVESASPSEATNS